MSDDHESRITRLEHEVNDNLRPKMHEVVNVVSGIKATFDLERMQEDRRKGSALVSTDPNVVTWPMLKTVAASVLGTLGIVATVLTILHLLGKL